MNDPSTFHTHCMCARAFCKIKNFRSDKEILLLLTHANMCAIKCNSQQLQAGKMIGACVSALSCCRLIVFMGYKTQTVLKCIWWIRHTLR